MILGGANEFLGCTIPFGNKVSDPRMANSFSAKTYISGLVVVMWSSGVRFKAVPGLNEEERYINQQVCHDQWERETLKIFSQAVLIQRRDHTGRDLRHRCRLAVVLVSGMYCCETKPSK